MNFKVQLVKKKSPIRILSRDPQNIGNDSRITRITENRVYLLVQDKDIPHADMCLVQYSNILFSSTGKVNSLENTIESDEEFLKFKENPSISVNIQEEITREAESTPLLDFIKNRKLQKSKKELYQPKNIPAKSGQKKKQKKKSKSKKDL